MINKLGFGFLRLPKKGEALDWQTINAMTDAFLEGGGSFFDTCYTYLDGMSEAAIRKCLVERKNRSSFQLCNKLPGYLFKGYEDCQKYFDIQRQRCGVDFFDVLMLHWLNDENYAIAEKHREFRFLQEKKAEGTAKRIGFSYHGDAALLEKILPAYHRMAASQGTASDCIGCQSCEAHCPQKLNISRHMEEIAEKFEA